jgi:hypothetical protein
MRYCTATAVFPCRHHPVKLRPVRTIRTLFVHAVHRHDVKEFAQPRGKARGAREFHERLRRSARDIKSKSQSSAPVLLSSGRRASSTTRAPRRAKRRGPKVISVGHPGEFELATIMTDPELAHRTYIEPLTTEYIEERLSPKKSRMRCCHRGRTNRAKPRCRAFRERRPRKIQSGNDRRAARAIKVAKTACGLRTPAARLAWKFPHRRW